MTEIKVVREDVKATAILKAIRQIDDGAELEPVVRCKDCRHWKKSGEGCGWCESWEQGRYHDGFCNFGERKRNG